LHLFGVFLPHIKLDVLRPMITWQTLATLFL